MTSAKSLFVSSLIIASLSLSACKNVPEVETCIVGDGECICFDPRLPQGKQDYVLTLEECRNFIARSSESEMQILHWMERHCR
jgi:hypothetical protein